jgi:hypothetical protein
MSLAPDDHRVEDALRGAAAAWRDPSPRPGLAARVRADITSSRTDARTIPWFAWIPAGSALALVAILLGVRFFQPPAEDTVPPALQLASVPDQITRWPELVDQAGATYRREWEAVTADVTASGAFMAGLVSSLPSSLP